MHNNRPIHFLSRRKERLVSLATVFGFFLLFGTFLLTFLSINLWDCDFWYHISSGRYIVTTGSLPDKDPFSYTTYLKENDDPFPDLENLVLKHYWLSQVIFYLIYDYAGTKGIIILRSILLTLTIFVVYWRLQRWSVSTPVSFIFIFFLYILSLMFTGERPVLFTIFFTALTFFILEDFKLKKDARIFLLAPLMLLWANLHGGFILGAIIITTFMAGEGLEMLLKRSVYARRERMLFYTATTLALVFSYINPTGWADFYFAFSQKYKPIFEITQEYQSPFYFYKHKLSGINYGYLFFIVIFPIILMLRNRKLELTHVILLSGMLIKSIFGVRFMIYYGIIAAASMGKESDILIMNSLKRNFSEKTYKKIIDGLTIMVLISTILFTAGFFSIENIRFNIRYSLAAPKAAVDFVEKNNLKGNMFNDYGYGGYIIWRLYPWKKNFFDTRTLNYTVLRESLWIRGATEIDGIPLWKKLLNHYRISFIILPLLDGYGENVPLIFKLIENDDEWVPIFIDRMSIVFMRNNEQNRNIIQKFKLPSEDVYNAIIYRGTKMIISDTDNPRPFISLGETFHRMGRLNDSLKAYKYAFERMQNPAIQEEIKQIELELKAGGKKESQSS